MDKVEISIRTGDCKGKKSKAERLLSAKVLRQNYPERLEYWNRKSMVASNR